MFNLVSIVSISAIVVLSAVLMYGDYKKLVSAGYGSIAWKVALMVVLNVSAAFVYGVFKHSFLIIGAALFASVFIWEMFTLNIKGENDVCGK